MAATALTACDDTPLSPRVIESSAPAPAPASANIGMGLHSGQAGFLCVLTQRVPGTPHAVVGRKHTTYFPRSEVSASGRTIRYSFIEVEQNEWSRGADCVIPYTEAGIRRMNRLFRTDRPGVTRIGPGGDPDGVQLMGCVSDGMCSIEGITVVAPRNEAPAEDHQTNDCTMYGECAYSDWYNSGGTYGTGGWSPYGDTDGDGDLLDEGPITFAACVAGKLGIVGWLSVASSAVSAWQLWGAHVDVRDAEKAYLAYKEFGEEELRQGRTGAQTTYNYAHEELLLSIYNSADQDRNETVAQLALSLGVAGASLRDAAVFCAAAAVVGA
jgi:hypothetical protein